MKAYFDHLEVFLACFVVFRELFMVRLRENNGVNVIGLRGKKAQIYNAL